MSWFSEHATDIGIGATIVITVLNNLISKRNNSKLNKIQIEVNGRWAEMHDHFEKRIREQDEHIERLEQHLVSRPVNKQTAAQIDKIETYVHSATHKLANVDTSLKAIPEVVGKLPEIIEKVAEKKAPEVAAKLAEKVVEKIKGEGGS